MKNYLLFLVLFSWGISSSQAQIIDPNKVTFAGLEQRAAEYRRAVVSIHRITQEEPLQVSTPIGSGFLCQLSQRTNAVVTVTCAHVIKNLVETNLAVGLLRPDQGVQFFKVKGSARSDKDDLAALILNVTSGVGNIAIPYNFLTDTPAMNEGRGLILLGYPLSLGVELAGPPESGTKTNLPIVRSAMVARRPLAGVFLIDCIVNGGTSGSVVADLITGKVVGIVQAYHTDRILLRDENGDVVAYLPYNSGLGRVREISSVRSFLDFIEPRTIP